MELTEEKARKAAVDFLATCKEEADTLIAGGMSRQQAIELVARQAQMAIAMGKASR